MESQMLCMRPTNRDKVEDGESRDSYHYCPTLCTRLLVKTYLMISVQRRSAAVGRVSLMMFPVYVSYGSENFAWYRFGWWIPWNQSVLFSLNFAKILNKIDVESKELKLICFISVLSFISRYETIIFFQSFLKFTYKRVKRGRKGARRRKKGANF